MPRPPLPARAIALTAAALLCLGVAGATVPAVAAEPAPAASPWGAVQNLDRGAGGRVVFANTTPAGSAVLSLAPGGGGPARTVAVLPARPGRESDVAVAAQNAAGDTWIVFAPPEGAPVTTVANVYYARNGHVRPVLNTAAYQATDPDPYNLDGTVDDSNPYDVEVLPDGSALITDAANNDLLRVWPGGHVRTVACFPSEVVPTSSIPFPWDGPPEVPAEAVPTGVVAVSKDSALVSELKGFPFAVGSSQVWKVRIDRSGQGCDGNPAAPVPPGILVADGLTAAVDITTGPGGRVYVTELNRNGVFAAEAAFADPSTQQGQGGLVRLTPSGPVDVEPGDLSFPGSSLVDAKGRILVANNYLFGATIDRVR